MKKKSVSIIAVFVLAVVTGFNVYIAQNNTQLSDLELANIDALTNTEAAKPKMCNSTPTPVNTVIDCPDGVNRSGFQGVKFVQTVGNLPTYRVGSVGTAFYCSYPFKESYDNTEVKTCK